MLDKSNTACDKPDHPGSETARGDDRSGDSLEDRGRITAERPKEIGGPAGPDPTRYGDWEKAGRCIDF